MGITPSGHFAKLYQFLVREPRARAWSSGAFSVQERLRRRNNAEKSEKSCCEDNGQLSCDPVVLFKLVPALVCIRSQRKTKSDAEVNGAYRWFLVYSMSQKLPNFATISYAFRHRFTGEVVESVWIRDLSASLSSEKSPGGRQVKVAIVCVAGGRHAPNPKFV